MGSTRLPGKVSLPLDGTPVLTHVCRRAQSVPAVDKTVVATSFHSRDDLVATLAERAGCSVFRGSDDDVLGRLSGAARAAGADVVLRVTADNPFVGIPLMSAVVETMGDSDAEYVSTKLDRSFPLGVDAEAFAANSLHQLASQTTDPRVREHVTPHFLEDPGRSVRSLTARDVFPDSGFPAGPELRMTLDVPLDYEVYREVYDSIDYDDVLPAGDAARYILQHGLDSVNGNVSQETSY